MKNSFLKQNCDIFINSFKRINLKIFLILFFDILFYFIFMQAGNFFMNVIQKRAANVDLTQNFMNLNQQVANTLLTSVRGFFSFLIISLILFAVLMIINWSLFKGLNWAITANKKFNLKFFKKFLQLNLIWLPIWFLLIFLFAIIIKPTAAPIYMVIILIIAFYLTNILYPLFLKHTETQYVSGAKKSKAFLGNSKIKTIKEAFKLGIKKIHHFIMPYLIIIIFFLIISKLYKLITLNIDANPNIFFGIILIFIAWMRYYFVEIVESLSK